ncbi:DUF4129 domain-containing protein [Cellulomonas pakistanensis]|uniref:Protein-glutamine gamma-glutamyltransferase-like C-terminal domain-containing protein n=1 Tax=Cellulomonas pakistanensis TaxID=992287 RepID=A0A919U6C8_9CELL|nr:DUF4129 domain-containing protein [Cellulomonas pakistanensis]GIG36130.1 hypothetical protein Cpa01nite_15110 [Cellulomonas pakistanensis]
MTHAALEVTGLLGAVPGVVAAAGRATEVPVVPDAEQARGWLERELADPVYHEQPSLLQRLLDWLGRLFEGADGIPVGNVGTLLAVLGGIALLVLIAFLVTGPVRRNRRVAGTGTVLDSDDRRTAAELRAAADAAAARGDWDAAAADRFRAVVRALEERAVLDERPGRTAHEAVEAAGVRLPAHAVDLRAAGRLFDDVVYGERAASAADDAGLRELDARVAATRPTLPAGLAGVDA